MYYLPDTKELGALEIINIYHSYDVPRTFLAYSKKLHSYYLAFWVNESEVADTWYYSPIDKTEIQRIENTEIQLRDIFKHRAILQLITHYNPEIQPELKTIIASEVNEELLPPEGFAIVKLDDNSFDLEEKPLSEFVYNEMHEVKLFRPKSKKPIPFDAINKIAEIWNQLYESIVTEEDGELLAVGAQTGCYKMQFSAKHNDTLLSQIQLISQIIGDNNKDINKLENLNVDHYLIEKLITSLSKYKLKLSVYGNSGNKLTTFDAKRSIHAKESLTELNQQYIHSELVFQANELPRITKLVKAIATNEPFDSTSEKISDRQIIYYNTASRLLGLTKYNARILTPIGWRLAEIDNKESQYRLLLERFETSDCGWAWMKYCDVDSVLDIPPDSAREFLLKKTIGLSLSTLNRRSSCLSTWSKKFKVILGS